VSSVGDGSPLLAVSCLGRTDEVDNRAVQALAPIASHIAELDLGRTQVGDDGCKVIAGMGKLIKLDLRQSAVGNQGVAQLAACKELRVLNLFGTKVGDYGMAALEGLKSLEQLYLWQTDVSAGAVVKLREKIAGVRVVMAAELPDAMPEGAGQRRRAR